MKKFLLKYSISDFIVFLLATSLFIYIFITGLQPDIRSHLVILQNSLDTGIFPIPPLYYLTIYIASGFVFSFQLLGSTALIVLGLSVMFKFKAAKLLLAKQIGPKIEPISIEIVTLCLIVVMSIVSGKRLYLGEPSPNLWHNSTTIFLMPFAILLFYITSEIVKKGVSNKRIILFFSLILINVLIKPSFLFVFSFLPIVYLIQCGFDSKFKLFFFGSLFALVTVGIEMGYLFLLDSDPYAFKETQEKNGIEIDPFFVWSFHSKNVLISFLSSIAFPVSLLFFKPNILRKNFILTFAWVQFLLAILIFSLFVESGFRKYDANFSWQIIPSLFILFTVSLADLFKNFSLSNKTFTIKNLNPKGRVIYFVFLIHTFSGLIYILNIILFKQYR